ncbi:hypothetical protein F511_15138 [Dorcoceras hygrometricum]|uniref:Uncharacterized protein n=1 Tax=Dorcoceras hygrometricum TaxID=472368 RepID=A0A2Z7B639_9LAMI|nr:hypothetical protein F511_15138 [Dorcoceras hygrometricum]
MSSWTKSSVSLSKLHEAQKPLNDKSGLGFNVGKSSAEETNTQSHLVYDKFKKMSFVKASVIYDSCESVRYDDQNSSKPNQKGKAGIGYLRPENSKPSWLKNRLDKDKAKAGSKSFVSHQPRRSSKKIRQSGPRPEGRLLRQPALEGLTRSARTDSPRKTDQSKSDQLAAAAAAVEAGGGGGFWERKGAAHLGALGIDSISVRRHQDSYPILT